MHDDHSRPREVREAQAKLAEQMEVVDGRLGERDVLLHGVEIGKAVLEGGRWRVFQLVNGEYHDLAADTT